MSWRGEQQVSSHQYTCGYCGNQVASDRGWVRHPHPEDRDQAKIYICPYCEGPTYFRFEFSTNKVLTQVPAPLPGSSITGLPEDVAALYDEIRKAIQSGAYTAAVLASRKLLMHLAVEKGAQKGESFA